MTSAVKRAWMPLVIVVVVAIAGFTVYRLRGVFGSHDTTTVASGISDDTKPFNPKHVTYEIFGEEGAVADHQLPGPRCAAAESR